MKIRNPFLLTLAGWAGTRLVRGLFRTLRYHHFELGPNLRPDQDHHPDRYIYCIWHENLLLPALAWGRPNIAVLISRHADGQLLGSLITSFGMGLVRGSTNRGGVEAVRKLTREGSGFKHLAITPDGPRGPRRVVQSGIIYIASRCGMKIVPVGVGYRRPWRANSWDRFAIPKPFSRACCVADEAIAIPPGIGLGELEIYRLQVQAAMDRLADLAERWAEHNVRPQREPIPRDSPRLAS